MSTSSTSVVIGLSRRQTSFEVVPVCGDALGAVLSLYVVVEAWRIGAPVGLLARMALNVAVDFLGGLVPVLGDLSDAVWKANHRNVKLQEDYVEAP
jgi:hypothetical protein